MNYLAHAYLAGDDPDKIVGNFIADHWRGNDFSSLPKGVVNGIMMHRQIDHFTDNHPLFKQSKRMFYNGFEKHSGILVDIYFDHLLASTFEKYHPESLHDFSEKTYATYKNYENILPLGSKRFLEYVLSNNIYTSYAQIEGIERVLNHLSYRIKHNVSLDQSVPIFKSSLTDLSKNFDVFFDEAINSFK